MATFAMEPNAEIKPNQVAWNALLEAYGYTWTDDLDLVLMDGICNGYFDPERMSKAARVVNEKVLAAKADGSFEKPGVLTTIYFWIMKTKS